MKRVIGAIIVVALSFITARYAYIKTGDLAWFKLSEVEIDCPEFLDREQVMERSNLELGESIFDQDFASAADSLVTLPGIEAVSIERKLPSGVKLQLHPDQVVLFVRTDKIYGLTRRLKTIEVSRKDKVLPVVTGLSNRNSKKYDNKVNLCYALSLFDELSTLSRNLSNRLSEIHFKNSELVELYFDPGGVRILMSLRNYRKSLSRLVVIDNRGLLGNSGSFDMTAGKMVVKGGV